MSTADTIRPRIRDAIIQSLRAGVTPRVGLELIQVGRVKEIEAIIHDVDRIADGASGLRFVIGRYGSGKTFFLNLVRSIAIRKKLVVVHADLNPDRRLHASNGQARVSPPVAPWPDSQAAGRSMANRRQNTDRRARRHRNNKARHRRR